MKTFEIEFINSKKEKQNYKIITFSETQAEKSFRVIYKTEEIINITNK